MKTAASFHRDRPEPLSEGAKQILERSSHDLADQYERTYRDFVESLNRAKDSEIERVLMSR